MKHHVWKTATGTLVLGVSLLGLPWTVDATKPKAPPAPSTTPVLTPQETLCQHLGTLALKTAQARESGASYLTLLAALRRVPIPTSAAALEFRHATEVTMELVYALPHLTPVVLRREIELGCLGRGSLAPPTATQDRY